VRDLISRTVVGAIALAAVSLSVAAPIGRSGPPAGAPLSPAAGPGSAEPRLRAAVASNPKDGRAREELGSYYLDHGRPFSALWELQEAVTLQPRQFLSRINHASALAAAGALDEASQRLREMLRLQPGRLEVCRRLADLALATARPADALAILRESRDLERSPEALVVLGKTHAALGETAEARAAYERSRALMPENPDAYDGLGRLFLAEERPGDARQAFMAVTFWDPKRPEAHYQLGLAALQCGSRREAESAFQAALKLDPDHRPSHLQLGLLALATGRQIDALRSLQAAAGDLATAEARLALAGIYDARGERGAAWRERVRHDLDRDLKARAAATCASWIAVLPDDTAARRMKVEIEAAMGYRTRALAAAEAALKRRPREPALLECAAERALAVGDGKRAAALCRAWLRLEPESARARWILGRMALAAKSDTQAVRWLEEAARRPPGDAPILRELGAALASRPARADRERAALLLERAVRRAPLDPSNRVAWALSLQGLGRHDDAREQLLRALDQDPCHLPALRGLLAAVRASGSETQTTLWARVARRAIEAQQQEGRLWQQTWDRPLNAAAYLALARQLILAGRLRPAQSQLDEALRLDPALADVRVLRDTVGRVLSVL
jgi:tetratricopeptide (TPR) repeat protein